MDKILRGRIDRSFRHLSGGLSLCLGEFGAALEARRWVVEVVDDGMDEDGLVVDGDGTVGRDGDPVVAFEGQGFAGDKDNVGASVTAFHGVVGLLG